MKKFNKFFKIVMFLILVAVLVYISTGLMFITMLALNYGVIPGILTTVMAVFSLVVLIKLLTE